MPFDIRSDAFTAAIPADSKLEEIAGNFGFTEGPIWHPSEHWLMFSDIQESHQYKWSEGEGLRVFRTPSNQANGNFFDRAGRVISCEHAASQLVRHEHDGKLVVPLATHYTGKELNSPNDVICDSKGRIWFTDPSFGRIREDLGILRDQELPYQGVFRLNPDGTLALVADDFQQPNGLCLSADESRLFVNDSWGGHIRVMDVTEESSVTRGVAQAVAARGPVQICVPNAGIAEGQSIRKTDLDAWRRTMRTNLDGAFLTIRACLPSMTETDWGRVIAVSSIAGLRGLKGAPAYTASKHGLIGLIKGLAADYLGKPYTFKALCPAYVDTEIVPSNIARIMERTGMSREEAEKIVIGANPHGRLITSEEVAEAALWLCAPQSASVNGQAIQIAGGEF